MSPARLNPFPGLRPFDFEEYELFFGREEQYEQMIGKLYATRFLAVVGTSGSGKSSLVRAGLLPALYGGRMVEAGSNWRVALFRPKDDPIRELALSLNHRRVFGPEFKDNLSPLLTPSDVTDWQSLCRRLSAEGRDGPPSPSRRIMELLPSEVQQEVLDAAAQQEAAEAGEGNGGKKLPTPKLIDAFNEILRHGDFYQPQGFARVILPREAKQLLKRKQEGLTRREVERLNRLLLEASYTREIARNGELPKKITEVTLRRGDLGLVEAVRQAKMAEGENLLIVVDQFEELFRYARISKNGPRGNQAAAFVKLLLQAKSQTELPIYVVITMRSDYLGDCARFWDLPEAINEGQYLIPRLTRDQRREAITGPVRMRGADITPQLVNQLLSDMGDDPDQLPILQHALMRTWDKWEADHKEQEPLDLHHYRAAGRMAGALSKHADEAHAELADERSRDIAEQLFKALTEKGVGENREVRRPTELRELRAITGAKVKELVRVIDVFRAEGRSFLLPSAGKPLARHTLIDISHESLIRNWSRLKNWVDEEAQSVNVYERLAETAKLNRRGRAGLLSDLEVEYALKWREEKRPNLAWASRYHASFSEDIQKVFKGVQTEEERKAKDREIFESAMEFLERSAVASRDAREERRAAERREQRQAQVRKFAFVLSLAFLFAAALGGFGWYQKRQVDKTSRANLHLIYGANINFAQTALEDDRNFASTNRLLQDADRVFEGKPESRGFEWYYLWASAHDELETLVYANEGAVSFVALSDNNTLATMSGSGTVKLRDMARGASLLSQSPKGVTSVTFSRDGRWLAVATETDGKVDVTLWDVHTGGATPVMGELKQAVLTMTFSPDGKYLAAVTRGGALTLFDTASGGTERLMGYADIMQPTAPNAPASAPEWDTERGSLISFSPDNRTLAVVWGDKMTTLIDIHTKEHRQVNLKQWASITSVALSKRFLALGREDSTIVLWDVAAGSEVVPLRQHYQSVTSVTFSREGDRLASGSLDGSIGVWDVTDPARAVGEVQAEISNRGGLDEDGGGGAGGPGRERWRNRQINERLLRVLLKGHSDAVLSLTFSADGARLVSGSRDQSAKLWDPTQIRKEPSRLGRPQAGPADDAVHSVAFSPDGKMIATGSTNGIVKLWNPEADKSNPAGREAPPPWKGHESNISTLAFSRDGKKLATGSWDGTIKLWDVATGRELLKLTGHGNGGGKRKVYSVAFSGRSDFLLASGGEDGTVRFWDVSAGKELLTPSQPHSHSVTSVAFSSDGRTLASGSLDRAVKLWDVDSRKVRQSDRMEHGDAVTSVAFSQDGTTLASGSADRTVKLWEVGTGHNLTTLGGHSKPVLSVGFSPDGKRLATGSEDGSVKVWDTNEELRNATMWGEVMLRELITLTEQSAVTAVAFSPTDGKRFLATSGAGNEVRLRVAATERTVETQRTPRFRN
ncbi:MAG TPA: WD40 repeat domain-containing protein [Pyrinomonadaceae bacterium]